MFQALKDKIKGSMGLKFIMALTGVVLALMVLGSIFVARMLMEEETRAIVTRGKELGLFLGRASTDNLLFKNIIGLDTLASEAVKSSEGMLYAVILDATGGASLTTLMASFNQDHPDMTAIIGEDKAVNPIALMAKVNGKLNPIQVSVDIQLEGSKLGAVKLGFSRAGVLKSTLRVGGLLLATSAGIVALLAALVFFMVRTMIVAPTTEAVAVASNIAAGDLSQNVRVRSNDELGLLGRGLNRMIIGLKGMIGNVREAAHKMETVSQEVTVVSAKIAEGSRVQAESVEEAASSVNEMHFALKEIAGNVEDLNTTSEQTSSAVIETSASIDEVAKTMTDLSSSIEDTSTAITQMTAAIRQIAENVEILSSAAEQTAASASEISASVREVESNARESSSLADAVASDAQHLGMRAIEKTMEGMGRIEESSRRTADVVNRLGERAESIGGILTVIEDITDQTSLLALNAAILAAQAGEHGKGFAVVATEIRELARRTASSTQEIGALIASVQEETREAVGAMRQGVASAEEGTRLSADAAAALRKIMERADQSRDMSKSISKAAAEQTNGMKQVSEAVDKINEMTHQIAKATNEQKTGSDQIIRASERMRDITRFVKNATTEQARGSKEISAAVENMNARIGLVHRAAAEVRAGSDLIVKAIDRIKATAKENADLAQGLNSEVDVMAGQAGLLQGELRKFKV